MILDMTCKYILLITFLNEPEFILLYTIKWFVVFLTRIILSTINHLHAFKWYQELLCISYNSIKHQLFVYTQ